VLINTTVNMSHSILAYIPLKIAVSILRFVVGLAGAPPPFKPDESYEFKSRDKTRDIKVNVYHPPNPTTPSPVVLNWHGSGFVLPLHGSDDEFCRLVATKTGFTVLDAAYALAPEFPFPAALHDVEDLILAVLEQKDKYDPANIVLSGFSAGGNLAVAAAIDASIPKGVFRGLMAIYPVVDLSVAPGTKRAPDGSVGLPPAIAYLFNSSYIPAGVDAKDPRISPASADPASFPDNVFIVTAEKDSLALEAENLAEKLKAAGKHVVLERMDGVPHAFDKSTKAKSIEEERKNKTYDLAVQFLQNIKQG
jgi:acetyl esterase/lipase